MMRTYFAFVALVSLSTACAATDDAMNQDLADGEQAWSFSTKATSESGDLPPCTPEGVEGHFELRVLRGEAGELLAIYTQDVDQRFDEYVLDETDPELLELAASRPGEAWQFALSVRDARRMIGFAVEKRGPADAPTCASTHAVEVLVYGN